MKTQINRPGKRTNRPPSPRRAPLITAITALLLFMPALAQDPPHMPIVVSGTFINQLAESLRTNSPGLRAAAARIDAARADLAAVRSWEDPMLRLGAMFADATMRAEEGDMLYGIEQRLPLFGRPQLDRKVAGATLVLSELDAAYRFQTLRRDLAKLLFRTALAERAIEVGDEDYAWLQQVVRTAEQRYQAGESPLSDVLRLQSERRRQQEALETARQDLSHTRLTLNRLLNRDLGSPWPTLRLPEPAGPVAYSDALVQLARSNEPRLKSLRQESALAEASALRARRARLPEVVVGAQARNASGNGQFRQAELTVGLSFPWGNRHRYRADHARETARAMAAVEEAADYALGVAEEVHGLTVRLDASRREALAYRDDIIPRSTRALESAQASWLTGRSTFLDVLEARRVLLEARLTFARSVTAQYEALSELVLCCGLGDLEALPMLGINPTSSTP